MSLILFNISLKFCNSASNPSTSFDGSGVRLLARLSYVSREKRKNVKKFVSFPQFFKGIDDVAALPSLHSLMKIEKPVTLTAFKWLIMWTECGFDCNNELISANVQSDLLSSKLDLSIDESTP